MKALVLLLPLLSLAAIPAMAQCGPSHGGHSGHVQEAGPKVKATNTICPVMGQPIKPGRDREVVIRGNYYLVCCDGCGPEMSEHHDKYLDTEGRPLNDPGPKEQAPAGEPARQSAPSASGHEGHPH